MSGASSPSPSTIVAAAASAAPAETPTRPGSASGLRNSPCISAPDGGERRADEKPEQQARQAHLQDDERIAAGHGAAGERVRKDGEDARRRNAGRAEAQPEQG